MSIRYGFLFLMMMHGLYLQAQDQLSIDGQWEIIFDDRNEGREAKWMLSDVFAAHPGRRSIPVPAAWERFEEDYEGVAFYRKAFEVPADWAGKIIRLQFGAVNYIAEVWLNDEVVGFHEGGFTPFEFRVDEMIRPGETNVLTLRVVGPLFLSDKEIDGMRALEMPQWRGGITGGIWQSVQLTATGVTYVEDVFIQPNIADNTAGLQVALDHTAIRGTSVELEIRITEAADPSKTVTTSRETWNIHPGQNRRSWTLKIPNAVYWSPDNPHLYRAEVKVLRDGEISDSRSERFGMRELTIKNKDFYLNGEPIYIKASFFEGLYPNGIAYPDSEEMARKEIRLAKEAGFNMIRPWRRPPAPMWLDLADEMGVLVVGSPALECMTLPLSTPYLPARVENEVRQAILRDRNRACVVQWELFNELHRPVLKQLMRPMAMLARDLDPTRLILDESGGWAYGANMYLPNEYEPTKFNDIHNYPGPFIDENQYDGYLSIGLTDEEKKARGLKGRVPGRNVVPGLMSYVSELGYGSLPNLVENNARFERAGNPLTPAYRYHKRLDEGQRRVLAESGFSDLYPDMQQFYLDQQAIHGAANKRMIEAVRANPEVDGYCIHALAAGDWIMGAGLIDLWRNPKIAVYEATKAANQPRILSIRAVPRNVYAERGAGLEILGINDLDATTARLMVEIMAENGKTVYRKELDRQWDHGVSSLFRTDLITRRWKGSYTVKARALATDGRILTENTIDFDVFRERDLRAPRVRVAVMETERPLAVWLREKGMSVVGFDSSTSLSTPVFVTGASAKTGADRYDELLEFVRRGGTAVYLEGAEETIPEDSPVFPFTATVYPARGLWTCIPHVVRDHPIFEGLPANGMMRNEYENIWPTNTLRELKSREGGEVEPLVASIGFDWFSKDHKLHYSGPGDAWWGSDVAAAPFGQGRCFISQLRLVENLGRDPAADKILINLVRFLVK